MSFSRPTVDIYYVSLAMCAYVFELCRCSQQPSLTFCPVGGQPFGLLPVPLLKYREKWTEMTVTKHVGTLGH
jgi:hypothetical protein